MTLPAARPLMRLALTAALMSLLVLSASDAEARKGKKPTGPTYGMLEIYSTNPGAQVEIDGKAYGQLPFKAPIKLTTGTHTIRVFLRGYTEFNDTFKVAEADDNELEVDLIPEGGILELKTDPAGASVKVAGKALGVTPFDQVIPLGKIEIEVERPGYEAQTLALDVLPGKRYTYDLKLVATTGASISKSEFYETWWFWTIIGVVVAGSATTVALLATQDTSSSAPSANAPPLFIP